MKIEKWVDHPLWHPGEPTSLVIEKIEKKETVFTSEADAKAYRAAVYAARRAKDDPTLTDAVTRLRQSALVTIG